VIGSDLPPEDNAEEKAQRVANAIVDAGGGGCKEYCGTPRTVGFRHEVQSTRGGMVGSDHPEASEAEEEG